jgi:hypothetical protein
MLCLGCGRCSWHSGSQIDGFVTANLGEDGASSPCLGKKGNGMLSHEDGGLMREDIYLAMAIWYPLVSAIGSGIESALCMDLYWSWESIY